MFLSIALGATAGAQGRVVDARVHDEFRRPIRAAMVRLAGSSLVAETDSTGRALLRPAPAGPGVLHAVRGGFEAESAAVLVLAADTTLVRIELQVVRTQAQAIEFSAPSAPIDTTRLRFHVVPEAIVRYRQVVITATAIRAGGLLSLRLFDDFALSAEVTGVEPLGTRGSRIVVDLRSPSGRFAGEGILVNIGSEWTANLRIGPSLYMVRPQSGGIHLVIEVDPTRLPPLTIPGPRGPPGPPGPPIPPVPPRPPRPDPRDTIAIRIPEHPPRVPMTIVRAPPPSIASGPTCAGPPDLEPGRYPEIRVLIGYSPLASSSQGGASQMEAMAVLALDEMRLALEESGVRAHVALAGVVEVAITEQTDQGEDYWKARLLGSPPSVSAIETFKSRRDAIGADAAVLVIEYGAGGVAQGSGWPRASLADSAFVVLGRFVMNTNLSLPHELGHLLGGADPSATPSIVVPPARYTRFFRCRNCPTTTSTDAVIGPTSGWVTLMGYPEVDETTGGPTPFSEKRIPRYSSPDRLFEGHATGVPIGDPAQADHRATFEHAAATVSAYRLTPAWFVAASGASAWGERYVATETRDEIRLADLDGDGLADAFRSDAVTGTWWWARDTRAAWVVLNGPGIPLRVATADVRFANLVGDARHDVFWIDGGKWMVSDGGTGPATTLNSLGGVASPPLEDLAFGDFDGNGRSDVFRSVAATGNWYISRDGSGPWEEYLPADATRRISTKLLRFADFDGDGRTDVFDSHESPTVTSWRYVAAGTASWTTLQSFLATDAPELEDLAFGRFDTDVGDDILVTTGAAWQRSSGGSGPLTTTVRSCRRMRELIAADIDGDGILDLLRSGVRP